MLKIYGFILMGLIASKITMRITPDDSINIVLVVTSPKGKTQFAITDTLKIYSEKEILELIAKNKITDLKVINTKSGYYLRTIANNDEEDNLDFSSVTPTQFWKAYNDLTYRAENPVFTRFEKVRNENIGIGTDIISVLEWDSKLGRYTNPKPTKTKSSAISFLVRNKPYILQAAKKQNIDPSLLGAILIDEFCRIGWEDAFDVEAAILFSNRSFSIGVAQVEISTAKTLIKKGYYTPNSQLDFSKPENRRALISYLDEPNHSINFAAANIRKIIDDWKRYIDLSNRPEIIGTIYSQGNINKPHSAPVSNSRGDQIKNGFYPIAQRTLKSF